MSFGASSQLLSIAAIAAVAGACSRPEAVTLEWREGEGASFVANTDDDDGDGVRDAFDEAPPRGADLEDVLTLTADYAASRGGGRLTLSVEPPSAAEHVNVHLVRPGGEAVRVLGLAVSAVELGALGAREPLGTSGSLRFLVEGIRGRTGSWDGRVTLVLSVDADGAHRRVEKSLRAAPIVLPDSSRRPKEIYVTAVRERDREGSGELSRALSSASAPASVFEIPGEPYANDRWVQDAFQAGYQVGPGGRRLTTFLSLPRPSGNEGLEYFVTRDWLGPDRAYVLAGAAEATTLNHGGNLEVLPPHEHAGRTFSYGRILIGGGDEGTLEGKPRSARMAAPLRALLEAQEVQAPVVEISTEWLKVGHVDEVLSIVPDRRPGAARPWKIAIASPALAMELGARPPPESQRYNELAQRRIDGIKRTLAESVGLAPDDFVDVPVLFRSEGGLATFDTTPFQSVVALFDRVVVALPEPGTPAASMMDEVRARYGALGLEVVFASTRESYEALKGTPHCAVEVDYAPYDD